MEELKPCPFCGGEAKLIKYRNACGCVLDVVQCQSCSAMGTPVLHKIHCQECAEDNWNHRVPLRTMHRRAALENDNAEVYLDAYQELLQKAEDLNEMLLKKLKTSPENKPLTVEQLKQMIGQPVWVEPIKSNPAHITPCWHGIERVNDDRIVFSDCIFWLNGLNKTYHAYTRKPEGCEKAIQKKYHQLEVTEIPLITSINNIPPKSDLRL